MMSYKGYPKDKFDLLIRLVKELELEFSITPDQKIIYKDFIIYYDKITKDYTFKHAKNGKKLFITRSSDRLKSFLWKKTVLVNMFN